MNKLGIKQRMERAQNNKELEALWDELKGYSGASNSTRRKCKKIMARKLKELDEAKA